MNGRGVEEGEEGEGLGRRRGKEGGVRRGAVCVQQRKEEEDAKNGQIHKRKQNLLFNITVYRDEYTVEVSNKAGVILVGC